MMKDYMLTAFGKVYGLSPSSFIIDDTSQISDLTEEYASWEYLYAPSLPFTFSCEGNFPWGNIELQLNIKEGRIQSVGVYTDALDHTLPDLLKDALKDCIFRMEEIEKAIITKIIMPVSTDIANLLKSQELS